MNFIKFARILASIFNICSLKEDKELSAIAESRDVSGAEKIKHKDAWK